MSKWHVTYSYLATGMEGKADTADCGIFEASTAAEAREMAVLKEYPMDKLYGPGYSSRDFYRGCLSVKPVIAPQEPQDGLKYKAPKGSQNQPKPVLDHTVAFQEGQDAHLGRVSPTNPYRVAMRSLTDLESLERLNKLATQWEDGYVAAQSKA